MDQIPQDLSQVPQPTEDNLTATLANRFQHGQFYTRIASSVLIQLNPFHSGKIELSENILQDQVLTYKDGARLVPGSGHNQRMPPPHAIELATSAYLHMRRTGQDQSIITSGQSGSGKTEGARQVIRQLLALSSAPKKESRVQNQIQAAGIILEAFGHAKTSLNDNASRVGRFTELQFNERGRLLGAKMLDYFLEKKRISQSASKPDERNFHIFYQLLAGATAEEKTHLRLTEAGGGGATGSSSGFNYLSSASLNKNRTLRGIDDEAEFSNLKTALKVLGFQKKQVAQIFQLLAAVLHLGNLTFMEDTSHTNDACVVRNVDNLIFVADILGVDPDALQNTLTYKTKMIKKELCSVFLDAAGAEQQRDELAQALYSLLFSWIVEFFNVKLCHDTPANFIGVVDMFGFQQYSSNGLDQFCVNYANERLHQFFLNQVFEASHADFELEGITSIPRIHFFDNSACLQMLGHQDPDDGLIGIMSRQSSHIGRKTDATMLEAFSKEYAKHDSLTVTRNMNSYPSFTVQHYLAPVSYTVDGWLEQNVDNLSSDFVTLFRGGPGVTPSMNTFVQGLFTDKALTTESHPRNNKSIVAAQQSIKPKRAPSMRRPKADQVGALTRAKSEIATNKSGPTAGKVVSMSAQIQSALQELCDSLEETTPWFLVCLKSNETGMPNHVDSLHVKSQVRSLCLAQIAQRLALEYTISCTHQEFLDRYFVLYLNLLEDCPAGASTQARMEMVSTDEKWALQDASVGRYRVYLSEKAWRDLEFRLKSLDSENKKSSSGKKDGPEQSTSAIVGEMGFQHAFGDPNNNNTMVLGTPTSFRGEILNMSEDDQSINSQSALAAPLLLQQQHLQQHQDLLQQQQQQQYFMQGQGQGQGGYYSGLHPAQASFMANERLENRSFYSGDDNASEYDPYMRGGLGGPGGEMGERFSRFENESVYGGSEIYRPNTRMFGDAEKRGMMMHMDGTSPDEGNGASGNGDGIGSDGHGGKKDGEDEEEEKEPMTPARRNWVFVTYALTWWIPSFCLSKCGKMVRPDIRMAWREKVALCVLIGLLSAVMIFYMVALGELVCPHQYVYSLNELSSYNKESGSPKTAIRGEVIDMKGFMPQHNPSIVSETQLLTYAGLDATNIFPVQPSALCDGTGGFGSASIDPSVMMPPTTLDPISVYHDFRSFTNDPRPDWYFEKMVFMRRWRVGFVAYDPKWIQQEASKDGVKKRWAVIDDNLYDLTDYISNGRQGTIQTKTNGTTNANRAFMTPEVVELFATSAGQDVTNQFYSLPLEEGTKRAMLICLRNLFFVGRVDLRTSTKCQVSNYLLLVPSCLIVATIAFKFLAALQLGSKREPEEHDKFIILQVPCYTEGEESLRKTLDSLAALRYDDKRKLLFVIADGMIIGSGNDRPTPRIVLDILGVDPNVDPEPLSFLSLGEGNKQHNMGKVYSGLYEHNGHVVPYVVIVKVGTPTERQRPGNRGKRDSQMILMRFLNKVHFNAAMTPMELEMYHQIKNVIGVNPSFYEYTLMVDSDTEVMPDSLNRMVSVFLHDTKVMGLCGETQIANEKDSWVTMMQVYEYFISHHLAKAFESLFGSVTCLPGCFCMYRIRTPTKSVPLLISNLIIEEYSENKVDTLHKKNLLHLGEDRYLTTLMLKHFPNYKMTFTPDAQCRTNVPDQWKVLLSQRRRWINSTVHNLMELVFLPQLCGFCCFSMRFIVMIDLFATLIMPVTVIYIAYLIYKLVADSQQIPKLALIMIGAVYGLQAVIFILRRKWEHIGWMIVYILAIPMFSFYLPIYSFWHFDDFSWGNTRLVVGEKGRKMAVSADQLEGKAFDPKSIPQKKWSDYEQELWEVQTTHSLESKGSRHPYGAGGGGPYSQQQQYYGGSRAGSVYGGEMAMPMGAMTSGPFMAGGYTSSRPQSPALGLGMNPAQLQQQQPVVSMGTPVMSHAGLNTSMPGTPPTRSYSPAPQLAYQLQAPHTPQQPRNSWSAPSAGTSPGAQAAAASVRMSVQGAPLTQYQMQLLQQQQQQQQQGQNPNQRY